MSQTNDTYGLYKTPNIATIGAYVSVVVAIFFSAYVMSMHSSLSRENQDLEGDLQEAHNQIEELRELVLSSTQRGQPYVARPRLRPEAQPTVAQEAPKPSLPTNVQPAFATTLPELDESNDSTFTSSKEVSRQTDVSNADTKQVTAEDVNRQLALLDAVPEGPELDHTVPLLSPTEQSEAPKIEEVDTAAQEEPTMASAMQDLEAVTLPTTLAPTSNGDIAPEGEIITYNPEQAVVMLDIGRNRGAAPGSRYSLWRGKKYLGEVRVQKVFAIMSSCEVVTPLVDGVRVGDVAKIVSETSSAVM